jgi:hypothetical protein
VQNDTNASKIRVLSSVAASIYLQLHLYGPIVNKSHQKKDILIQT